MNREKIIKLAREAGFEVYGTDVWITDGWWLEELERFAALVAAVEREKVAAWMMARGYATGHGDTIEDLLVELEWQVRESEREACAKVCEDIDTEYEGQDVLATWCAAAIRARGQA
jgi:hypothetical protein